MSTADELKSILDEAMAVGVTSYDVPGPTKKGMPRKRRAPVTKAPKEPKAETPTVDANYAHAYAVKDPAGLNKIFDSLKSKQVVWVSYRSVMGGIGHQRYRPYTVGRRSKSKKYNMTTVTLLHAGQKKAGPSGMQTKLYRRGSDDVQIALGDMAATLKGIYVAPKGEETELGAADELKNIVEAGAGMSMAVAMAQSMLNKQTRELDKKATAEIKKLVKKYTSFLENATKLKGWKVSASYGLLSLDNEPNEIYIDIYWEGDPGTQKIDVTVEMTKGKKSKFHYVSGVPISSMGLSPMAILGSHEVVRFLKENVDKLLSPLFEGEGEGEWVEFKGRPEHRLDVVIMDEEGDIVESGWEKTSSGYEMETPKGTAKVYKKGKKWSLSLGKKEVSLGTKASFDYAEGELKKMLDENSGSMAEELKAIIERKGKRGGRGVQKAASEFWGKGKGGGKEAKKEFSRAERHGKKSDIERQMRDEDVDDDAELEEASGTRTVSRSGVAQDLATVMISNSVKRLDPWLTYKTFRPALAELIAKHLEPPEGVTLR